MPWGSAGYAKHLTIIDVADECATCRAPTGGVDREEMLFGGVAATAWANVVHLDTVVHHDSKSPVL